MRRETCTVLHRKCRTLTGSHNWDTDEEKTIKLIIRAMEPIQKFIEHRLGQGNAAAAGEDGQ